MLSRKEMMEMDTFSGKLFQVHHRAAEAYAKKEE